MVKELSDMTSPGALSDTELEQIIEAGWFGLELNDDTRSRIQPASFEPCLTDDAYLVPRNWTPDNGATILESLRRLPSKRRPKMDLSNGGLISPNPNFSYLVFLDGTYTIPENFWIRSSPKSTVGRMGDYVKLLADGQMNVEEVTGPFHGKLAALIEPRVFNSIIHPGLTMNQLRVFCGQDFDLNERELREAVRDHQLLYLNEQPITAESVNTRRGLEVHLDLKGTRTNGLVGFRAIGNPTPIDRRLVRHYPIQSYFEAIESPKNGKLVLNPTDRLLILATLEDIRIPRHLAAEMLPITLEHGDFKWHDAGFFDPGFGFGERGTREGKSGVLEVYSLGSHGSVLRHGQGCGRFVFHPFRNAGVPRQFYGGANNNYHDQIGAWFAKHFILPGGNLESLARELLHKKEPVMACPNDVIFDNGKDYFQGFAPAGRVAYDQRMLSDFEYRQKEDVEHDPLRKQPIPYVVICNPTTKKFFVYERGRDTSVYSEERLHGKIANGIGGHIRPTDGVEGQNPLMGGYSRELSEEVIINGNITRREHVGYINHDGDDVSRVHIGLLHIIEVDTDDVCAKDPELREGRMMTLEEYTSLEHSDDYEVEAWARITGDFMRQYLK